MEEVIRTRKIFGRVWEMQVAQIHSTEFTRKHYGAKIEHDGMWQATYYYGAEPKANGDVRDSPEEACEHCDQVVDKYFEEDDRNNLIDRAYKAIGYINTSDSIVINDRMMALDRKRMKS